MVAAAHQRLNALAEGVNAAEEIIKGQQHAFGTGDCGDFIKHAGNAGVGADEGAHVDIDRRGGSAIWRTLVSLPERVSFWLCSVSHASASSSAPAL
nr:Uncharacterised protein [Raoultella sp. NCTC 9187]